MGRKHAVCVLAFSLARNSPARTDDARRCAAKGDEVLLQLVPHNPIALNSRALVHLRMGNYAKAIGDSTVVLADHPQTVSSLFIRGVAHIRSGNAALGNQD